MAAKFKNKRTDIHPKTIPESHYFSWKYNYLPEFDLLFNQDVIGQIDFIIKPILAVTQLGINLTVMRYNKPIIKAGKLSFICRTNAHRVLPGI